MSDVAELGCGRGQWNKIALTPKHWFFFSLLSSFSLVSSSHRALSSVPSETSDLALTTSRRPCPWSQRTLQPLGVPAPWRGGVWGMDSGRREGRPVLSGRWKRPLSPQWGGQSWGWGWGWSACHPRDRAGGSEGCEEPGGIFSVGRRDHGSVQCRPCSLPTPESASGSEMSSR